MAQSGTPGGTVTVICVLPQLLIGAFWPPIVTLETVLQVEHGIRSRSSPRIIHARDHHRRGIARRIWWVYFPSRVRQAIVTAPMIAIGAGDFISGPVLDGYGQIGRRRRLIIESDFLAITEIASSSGERCRFMRLRKEADVIWDNSCLANARPEANEGCC